MMPIRTKVIAMGVSTGGVEALDIVLSRFTATIPPIVLVIHMPEGFTRMFAAHFSGKFNISVKEAQSGDYLVHGQALVAPAGKHMKIIRMHGRLAVECYVGAKVQFSMPSVDVLFESVAEVVGRCSLGAIMTGMGEDGARGLLKMREKGAATIGQTKETCAVYGMPKVAKEIGAVEYEVPLKMIADKIMSLL